jgi:2,4-dienoyl-CoA reductase-like NADH-dependent reductase (Old Yellow Enzyme family)
VTTVAENPSGERAFPYLFSPIRIGPLELPNRIVITSHGASEAFRNAAMDPDAYIEYLRRRPRPGGDDQAHIADPDLVEKVRTGGGCRTAASAGAGARRTGHRRAPGRPGG